MTHLTKPIRANPIIVLRDVYDFIVNDKDIVYLKNKQYHYSPKYDKNKNKLTYYKLKEMMISYNIYNIDRKYIYHIVDSGFNKGWIVIMMYIPDKKEYYLVYIIKNKPNDIIYFNLFKNQYIL